MAKEPRLLRGQVAAITGGARGIGKETARAFVAQGMRVAIGDLDVALAERTAAELGGDARAYPLDVTQRVSVETFAAAVEADLGPIDVFVNNAGIMPVGPFLEQSDESDRRQIDINVVGVLNGMKVVLPRFHARHRGHLVNIASAAGKGGFPGIATYCGTKHFVVGVSESVHLELRDTPIEVSCVMPSFVNTELVSGLGTARGVKNAEPQDVANGIVEALQQPRFDVFVPKSVGTINKVFGLLPRSGREAMGRAMKADQALMQVDHDKRRAYELRAAQSDPALGAGDQPKELTETTP
jgi:NADP-dependent 3-hydroxy acid dehydrogenase YdfG